MAVALLVVGVVATLARPKGWPIWVVPGVAALVVLAGGALADPAEALGPLVPALLFLLTAVPFAVLLDRLGFFDAAAERLGHGNHLVLGLWVLSALVTTVLNLDASVVLLTPLYVRVARRCGIDPVTLAFQPVLLAGLASSALPVSNLTNLIAASDRHLGAGDFLVHLGAPTIVATTAGWFLYRRALQPRRPASTGPSGGSDRALVVGGVVVAAVLVGFLLGPSRGIPEWAVAAGADVVLVALTRHVPVRAIPVDAVLLVASLGTLALAAAAQFDLTAVFGGSSTTDLLRITAVSAVAANAVNNLPAFLVALPHVDGGVWALLLGANLGSLLLPTGTLATLLWRDALRHHGIQVSLRQFVTVGATVALPALPAATATLVLLPH